MQFWTIPRATYVPGLCESNEVTVFFDPAPGRQNGARTQVKASGVHVRNLFHFLSEPASPVKASADDAARLKTNKVCSKLKPENFFAANDDNTVVFGTAAFQSVVREAHGAASLSFSCKYGEEAAEECRRDVEKLKFESVTDIRPCVDVSTDHECTNIWLSDPARSLIIRSSGGGEKITSVEFFELVTVGDPRLD